MDGATTAQPMSPDDVATRKPSAQVVFAAGVVCWRQDGDSLAVLLVHRPRYDDWSFPKGKLHPGELLPECAVRELAEETGVEAVLGRPLPGTDYLGPGDVPKHVDYWAGRVVRTGTPTAPATEVDEARWVRLETARTQLTADGDRSVLDALARLHQAGELATTPMLVVRHAVTRPRNAWPRADAERPLVAAGRRQAVALTRLLACWQPEHILTSPWRRCMETIQPYVRARGAKVRTKGGLTESGFRRSPGKAARHTARLLERDRPSALCTHRPVLRSVLNALRTAATREALPCLPTEDPYLAPGEVLVAHVTHRPAGGPRIVAVERHVAPR